MFVSVVELLASEENRKGLESTFADSMRTTLPGVPDLVRAMLLSPADPTVQRENLAILEFANRQAYEDYLASDAFRAAHPWSGRVPLISNSLNSYLVHTYLSEVELLEGKVEK